MAKRRGGGYRGNPYNAKAYKFTARRRAALKKAQLKSARERRIKVGIMAVGGIAAVGVGVYLGRNTAVGKGVRRDIAKQTRRFSPQHVGRAANLARARAAVNPINKETMRMAGAISPADAPRTGMPLHIGPHTPGGSLQAKPPDTSQYKRTDLGKQSEASVKEARAAIEAEAAWKASAEGSIARFTDTSEASLPSELTGEKIQPLRRETAARAVGQHQAARSRSGSPNPGKAANRDTVDMMIAGSIDAARAAHGVQTPIRTNPRATGPMHIGAGATAAEHDALWAEIDKNRGLSTTRPGVPQTTARAANTTSVPGVGTSHSPKLAVGSSIPGWHGLSKEKKADMRGIAEMGGLKINATGLISSPAKKAAAKKPPANPSGRTPRQPPAPPHQISTAFYDMPHSAPQHNEQIGNWNLFSDSQKDAIRKNFQKHSQRKNWRMMLDPGGRYFSVDW